MTGAAEPVVRVHAVGDVPGGIELEMLDGSIGRYALHVPADAGEQAFYLGPCPGCVAKGQAAGSILDSDYSGAGKVMVPLERRDGRGSVGLVFATAKDWTSPTGQSTQTVCGERNWHAGCFEGAIVKGRWRRARALRDWGQYAR